MVSVGGFELELHMQLPASLDDAITRIWDEVDGLTLEQALRRFTAGLVLVPHAWSKRYQTLAEGTVLTPEQGLRLALLSLGELPCTDRRSYEGRIEGQPWHRAYALLADGFRQAERLAELDDDLRWLVVDAVLDGCELDTRVNGMQEATGWVSAASRIDRERGLGLQPTIHRMWQLAARGFEADGYDDGSYELTFDDLADHVQDAKPAAELRLLHAFLDYASTPWVDYEREQLRVALERAETLGIDIGHVRAVCVPIVGSFFDGELPLSVEALGSAIG